VDRDRLLVVDDDPSFLDLMTLHLSNKGYEVERAVNGKEALHLLQSDGPFQILVTDLMMPGLSGLELLRRARELDPNIEVIVITAAGSIEMAISALREDGAYDYLTKPLDLIGELSLAVERAKAHRKLKLEREDLRGQMIDGAGRLKAILTHTGDAILAVNQNDEVIVASPSILKLMTDNAHNGTSPDMRIPDELANQVKDWQMMGSPHGATIEIRWPNEELQSLVLSPLTQENGDSAGWVMMLHRISNRKILESYLLRRLTRVETELHQPLQDVHQELDRLSLEQLSSDAAVENSIKTVHKSIEEALATLRDLQGSFYTKPNSASDSARITLPNFVENERKQIGAVFEGYQTIRPVWEIEDGLNQLEIEPHSLHQIMHLLLLRATVLGEDRHRVKISFWHKGSNLWFEIADIGPGSGALESNPDFKFSEERKQDWLGKAEIQLAIVKSLVDQLNGQVWHYLNLYGGAAAAVCLPL
jgi:CheY-like chemotaxis protein